MIIGLFALLLGNISCIKWYNNWDFALIMYSGNAWNWLKSEIHHHSTNGGGEKSVLIPRSQVIRVESIKLLSISKTHLQAIGITAEQESGSQEKSDRREFVAVAIWFTVVGPRGGAVQRASATRQLAARCISRTSRACVRHTASRWCYSATTIPIGSKLLFALSCNCIIAR